MYAPFYGFIMAHYSYHCLIKTGDILRFDMGLRHVKYGNIDLTQGK